MDRVSWRRTDGLLSMREEVARCLECCCGREGCAETAGVVLLAVGGDGVGRESVTLGGGVGGRTWWLVLVLLAPTDDWCTAGGRRAVTRRD